MTKDISDIFLPIIASDGSVVDLCILIEGAPGIGKTVLTKEIAYQWAKNRLLNSKKLVLLIFLRECYLTQLRSVKGLMQNVFESSKMSACLSEYLLHTDGKDTVIIFDGYDELSEKGRSESVIDDIICRRKLTRSCLVITSRPTASSGLHGLVDRRVEIVGFTEEDRLDYIQTALRSRVNDEQVNDAQVTALQTYLQSNPTINALCYIPLNMTILLCLVEDGIDTLPKTQTKMYKNFIQMTIVRFIKKYGNYKNIISIANLPHPYDKLFVELAKVAFKALMTDKIVFTLSEITDGCPNLTMTSSNWNGLGLLKAVQYFSIQMGNDQVTFHFLHFSIQEYMAAWYISTLSDSKQIKLLQKTFWEHRYYNTWIMYVGITGGSSFALRHFLSGNWFQLYSKLFRSSKVSNKFLKHKMKCLHLFQCLVEADKEDVIKSVKLLFENKQIDLSRQTLLPSDLNTLGFFLIRSINKEWDELNLSNCNIGSNGSNILCDTFMDKEVRCIVTIRKVNFSYNQLNFSSLIRLFDLFNSWHTSEIIINNDPILHSTIDIKAIENIFLQSSTLVLVLIVSCLFCKNTESSRMLHVLLSTTNVTSIYLLNCTWMSIKSEFEALPELKLLEKQKLSKVRIIGTSLDYILIKTLALILINNSDSVNMFVYDPTMCDQIADDISTSILSSDKDISGVMLIVSSSKVQGIVNTCLLSNELSALEIFNLSIYIRYLNTKRCPWREHLEDNSHNNEIIYTFIKLIYKTDFNWKLKINLWENDILIVHKTNFVNLHIFNNKSVIYLSNCGVNILQYDVIDVTCSNLHILNSPDFVELLHNKLLHKQLVPNKLFIYGNIKYNLMNSLISLLLHDLNISAVLAVNGVIVGVHPNSELIALAFQLQPLPTTWILSTTDNTSVFYQVIDAIPTEWVELDFTGCNIGDMDCELMQKTFRYHNCTIVRKLNISFNNLSVSGLRNLARIVLIWGVQKLSINGTNDVLLDCFVKNLTCKHQDTFFLSITNNHRILLIVCNASWDKIVTKMNDQVSELHIINCKNTVNSTDIKYLRMAHKLQRLCIANFSISEAVVTEIIQTFLKKNIEVSISDVTIVDDDRMIKKLLTSNELYLSIKLNFVLSTDHWLCVYNGTKYQLQFIHKYFTNQAQPSSDAMTTIKKFKQVDGNIMYLFERKLLNVVRVHAKALQATDSTKIIAILSNNTSLNIIEIKNYSITNENADNLATILHHNPQLQGLHLHRNELQTNSTVEIIKALHSTVNLKEFSLCYNDITDEAADDIAAAIYCNTKLKELDLSGNNLKTEGVIKIAVALQSIATLTILHMSNNYVSCTAANSIAVAITHLQEFDIGRNHLQALGAAKIARGLQKISTLTKLHVNDNKITEEAADEIAVAISCNSRLQDIDVSKNNLQTTGAVKIMKAMQGIFTLKVLYMNSNSITDEATDDISTAMHCFSQLQELNISNNKFQTEGVKKILKSLQSCQTLKKLDISNNHVTDKAAYDVAIVISCNTGLQELSMNGNNLKTLGATIIAKTLQKISTLTKLCMDSNNITDRAADDISAAISFNPHLKEFSIGKNYLQASGAIKIAKGLQNITALEKLHIHINNITQDAANDIAAAISCNTQMKDFDVSGNNLQEMGVVTIAKALQHICTLKRLSISNNHISSKAANDIAATISHNTKLEEFDVGGNNLKAEGVIKISTALQSIVTLTKLSINNNDANICYMANPVAVAVTCNTHLQEFIISGNRLGVLGTAMIAKSLQNISTLTKLYIANAGISDGAADNIAAAVSCNIHLQEFDIGKNYLKASGAMKIAKGLQKISTLTKLCVNNNEITHEAKGDIVNVISCNSNLEELDISVNKLQTLCAFGIARALQSISTLTKLYINDIQMTYKAAGGMAEVILCNSYLQELDIGSNALQTRGAVQILKSLKKISTLTTLYINNNEITDEAADDIAAVIFCNEMQVLDVSDNYLVTTGITKVAKALQRVCTLTHLYISNNKITDEATDDIAAVISCNPYLEEFDIGQNFVHGRGAIKLAKSFQQVSTLKKLFMDNNKITDEASNDIAAVIHCNPHLNEFRISGNFLTKLNSLQDAYFANRNLTKVDI